MFEIVLDFTTTTTDYDLYTEVVVPALTAEFGVTGGYELDLNILFDSSYTGDITIQSRVSKAWADTTLNFSGFVDSIVISENNTSGQIKLNF